MRNEELIYRQLRLKHAQEVIAAYLREYAENNPTGDLNVISFQQRVGAELDLICYNVEVWKNDIDANVLHINKWRWFM